MPVYHSCQPVYPVLASRAYGLDIIAVEDETQLQKLTANDPANGLNSYEVNPMLPLSPLDLLLTYYE